MTRSEAAAVFRKDAAAAIDTYHEAVGATWRKWGRPPSHVLCEEELKGHWQMLKYDLRKAGEKLDRTPVRLSQQEAYNEAA